MSSHGVGHDAPEPQLKASDVRPKSTQRRSRASGILLHPTSLPGPGRVGSLGSSAYRFVDFLATAHQSLWQIMPLGPVGLGNSPYAARSAFAGNPLLIAPEQPIGYAGSGAQAGKADQDSAGTPGGAENRVDYVQAEAFKRVALAHAYERFSTSPAANLVEMFERFREEQRSWLDDFALFLALKDAHDGSAWFQWDPPLVRRETAALEAARRALSAEIRLQEFVQFLFFEQWGALKRYANERHVGIVGDIPIFLAHDSADVWVHQDVFFLDANGHPTVVAGVPPDVFSASGQRWGNPLYRWDRLAARGYDWWIDRIRGTLQLVDIVRLDHFRGFQAYWEVPAEHETAERGRWVEGPGVELFRSVEAALGRVPILVEDLGLITPEVVQLREQLGYPGMKVLQFAFGEDASNPYLPHNHESDFVVYTGTHDNDTTVGWYASLDDEQRHHVRMYLGVSGEDIAWDFIRCAQASVADLAIVPLQDVLALDGAARMNYPGRAQGNWDWRYTRRQLHRSHAERLGELTDLFGRAPKHAQRAEGS